MGEQTREVQERTPQTEPGGFEETWAGGGGSLGQRIISLDFDVSSCVCHWYPKRKMAHRNSGAKSRPWKWVGESRAL